MELKLVLPEKTVRKMKALDALQGDDKTDFLGMVAEYIDMAVTERIARLLGLGDGAQTGFYAPRTQFDAAEGLSSEQVKPEDEEDGDNPFAPPGKAQKLDLASIEKDNQVEDPEHEAVSPDNVEMTFSEALSLPLEDEAPVFSQIPSLQDLSKAPRSNPKPLPKGVKARVKEFDGNERDPEIA